MLVHGISVTFGVDLRFWTVGRLTDFTAEGLTILLFGPLRVNIIKESICSC
jgi:hypothetical protein